MARIFIGFFGLTRALEYTIKSIEESLYAPLIRGGHDLFRAAHFNKPTHIEAPRSGEYFVPFNIGDIDRLRLDHVVIEPQSEDNIANHLVKVMRFPYRNEDDFDGTTRRNSLFQLYSLLQLSKIFEKMDPNSFDVVFLFRPDLRYLNRLPVKQLLDQLSLKESESSFFSNAMSYIHRSGGSPVELIVPSWQSFGGLNDRFAFATPGAALEYMTRIELVNEFCEAKLYYHSEELLDFAMRRAGVSIGKTWVLAQRIRSNGEIAQFDTPSINRNIFNVISSPWHRFMQL